MQFTSTAAEVDPLDLYYTHSKIRSTFSKGGQRVLDTIRDIENGLLSANDFPPITVLIGADGNKYCLDNRRLYVFKDLRRRGLLPDNKVTVLVRKAPPKDLGKYSVEKCSLNCTLMREKDILNDTSDQQGRKTIQTSSADRFSAETKTIREKNDKKKIKSLVSTENCQERYLRQKRIIEEKRKEFERQSALREDTKRLERAADQFLLETEENDKEDILLSESDLDDGSRESESETESDEEVFRCYLCRKDFKSEQQIEQHLASKSHKKKAKDARKTNGSKGDCDEVAVILRPKKKNKPKPQMSKQDQAFEITVVNEVGDKNDEKCETIDFLSTPLDASQNSTKSLEENMSESSSESSCDNAVDVGKGNETSISIRTDPIHDALMLLLIEKKISQLENKKFKKESAEDDEDLDNFNANNMRVTKGSKESREIIAEMEQRKHEGSFNQQLVKSFQQEGLGSKALPSQYVHKQEAAFDARRAANVHHTSSHYVMAGGVQFQRGVRVKGVVSRHSKQAARRNGPVGGGAQNMKRMGLLNEQRETGSKSKSKTSGKKKSKKNPSDM